MSTKNEFVNENMNCDKPSLRLGDICAELSEGNKADQSVV